MKRRDLFKLGAQKAVRIASHLAAEKVSWQAETWIRPPFARPELEFQLACTRCDKCIEACAYEVLFRLPAKLGRQVEGTPAMDLLNRGCHLCDDWPCVNACEPQALKHPGAEDETPPQTTELAQATELTQARPARVRLARMRINTEICLPYLGPECGACAHSCPVPGALQWEGGLRPVINMEECTGCALCREACITEPKAVKISAAVPDEG